MTVTTERRQRPILLHIGDTAGVASILAKFLESGHSIGSDVVGYKHLDPLSITSFYGGTLYDRSYLTNLRFILWVRRYKVAYVHVHADFVKRLRLAYPKKKLIVHFHGEDTRLRGWPGQKAIMEAADAVFYAQPDLSPGAPEMAVYLPIPVDTEHFSPSLSQRRANTALYFIKHQRGEDPGWPMPIAKRLGLELDVKDRLTHLIPYSGFPGVLNQYEFYFDRNYPESLSSTALQALACGLKVVDWKGDILTGFPAEHDADAVVEKFLNTLRSRGFGGVLPPNGH